MARPLLPPLLVAGPLKKKRFLFFAASLRTLPALSNVPTPPRPVWSYFQVLNGAAQFISRGRTDVSSSEILVRSKLFYELGCPSTFSLVPSRPIYHILQIIASREILRPSLKSSCSKL